jgi:predicted house-cleaning noncanonical NTP pyrophosphatase (MazG superfamily)
MENEYPKLVRDNIPAIIKERTGIEPEIRIAELKEFEDRLLDKIVEEAIELRNSGKNNNFDEELGDINELIETLLKLKNIKQEDIAAVQAEKKKKNGGFNDRIIMLSKVEKPKE